MNLDLAPETTLTFSPPTDIQEVTVYMVFKSG
jgi:hypothetical protein